MKLALLSLLFATAAAGGKKGDGKGKGGKGGKKTVPPVDECSAKENGIEVWKSTPNEEVKLRLTSSVDTDTCTYKMSLSWEPNPEYPFLGDVTLDNPNLSGTDWLDTCIADGLYQGLSGIGPQTPENHVGLFDYYTDFAFYLDVPEEMEPYVGFKIATLGASPCGTFLQPFPQYSVHFYDISYAERADLTCVSNGDYFCKPIEEQCSDAGRGFQMNGAGIPTCEGAPPGPPLYTNLPANHFWTLDGGPATINAATPAMGLHAVDPTEFAPTRDITDPYTLYIGHDSKVIGNHVLVWSGFAEGLKEDFTKDTPSYNCQTPDKAYYPTTTSVTYRNGRTAVSIEGPTLTCDGLSFTKVVE